MGKKGRKFKNKKKQQGGMDTKKHRNAPYQDGFLERTIEMGNFKMEAYYALQGIHNHRFNDEGKLVPCETDEEKNEERLRWRSVNGTILPASFRIAFDIPEELQESLEKELEDLVEARAKALAEAKTKAGEEEKTDEEEVVNDDKPIRKLTFLPHAFQFAEINRKTMRKDPTLKDVFEWFKRQADSGFITRQETVSMVPPVVLNPQPDDSIIDLCAAPGSKTCQILEKLSPKGSLVANDSSYARAYTMVANLKRIMHNNPVVLVTSAEAQFFPQTLSFDRILADVPCSGDGTSRKNIGIWKQWSQLGALSLHALQLDIAWKGVAMLKVGGYLCYSTCSYNPIENEAVVAELLRRSKGSLELVDSPLKGFKTRPGLSHWKVLSEEKSKRQMTNEKKKNNAKMRQRKAEFEAKNKADDAEQTDKTDTGASEQDAADEGEAEADAAEAGTELDETKAEEACDGDEDENGAETQRNQNLARQKFEAPPSWDDETLLGLAKSVGLLHFKSVDDVPEKLKKRVRGTCFPPTEEEAKSFHLEKCIRCLSHDNDTGGFFVALLKKVAPTSNREARQKKREDGDSNAEGTDSGPDTKRMKLNEGEEKGAPPVADDKSDTQSTEKTAGDDDEKSGDGMEIDPSSKPRKEVKGNRLEDGKGGKHKDRGRDDMVPVKEEVFTSIIEFFGLSDSFPKDQIMTRAIGDTKVLYYLEKSVKENFIDKGIQERVTIIGSGVKAFVRQTNWGSDCCFRLSQAGLHFIIPHMTKRKIVVNLQDFKKCLAVAGECKACQLSEFSDDFSAAATPLPVGPYAVILKGYETDYFRKLFLVMWRSRGTATNCMISKEDIATYQSKLAALEEETAGAK